MENFLVALNSVIQNIVLIFYFNGFMDKRKKDKYTYFVFGAAFLLGIIKCIIPISATLNLFLSIFIAAFVVGLNYSGKTIKKIFSVLVYVILMMATEIIGVSILSVFMDIAYGEVPILEKEKVAFLNNFLSFIIIVYIVKFPSGKIKDIPRRSWLIILLMPIFSFLMILIFDVLTVNLNTPHVNIFNVIIILGFLYFNIALFDFFDSFSAKLELEKTELLMKMQEKNYKILAQNENDLRILKHDISKHIGVVKAIIQNGNTENAEKYIDDLENTISSISSVTYTNHIAMDSILNVEALRAKAFDIDYFVKANIQAEIKIKDVDLTTLLHNAIDNAIEAAMQAEKKYVVVTINVYDDYINILVQNSYKLLLGKINYETIKSDKQNHGFGIPSMKNMVDRYNGTFSNVAENGINSLEVRLENAMI